MRAWHVVQVAARIAWGLHGCTPSRRRSNPRARHGPPPHVFGPRSAVGVGPQLDAEQLFAPADRVRAVWAWAACARPGRRGRHGARPTCAWHASQRKNKKTHSHSASASVSPSLTPTSTSSPGCGAVRGGGRTWSVAARVIVDAAVVGNAWSSTIPVAHTHPDLRHDRPVDGHGRRLYALQHRAHLRQRAIPERSACVV